MYPNPLLKIAVLAGGILLLSPSASAQKISAGVVRRRKPNGCLSGSHGVSVRAVAGPRRPSSSRSLALLVTVKRLRHRRHVRGTPRSTLVVGGERTLQAIARQRGAGLAAGGFSG